MWATLALMTALEMAPAQAPKLELTNIRVLHSVLGQERKDSKVLPGDVLIVAFDLAGLKVMGDGRVSYSMGMELTDKAKGKSVFKNDPEVKQAVLTLGGDRLPNYAVSVIGLDTNPGEYEMKVTVIDQLSKQTETLVRTFEVVKPDLGVVRVGLTYGDGQPAPGVGVPGQTLLLNFSVVGFGLDMKAGDPNFSIEMNVLDDSGKPTLAKPFTGDVKKVGGAAFKKLVPFDPIPLHLNRAGKYKVVIKATDNLAGKKVAEQTLNLTVLELNKGG